MIGLGTPLLSEMESRASPTNALCGYQLARTIECRPHHFAWSPPRDNSVMVSPSRLRDRHLQTEFEKVAGCFVHQIELAAAKKSCRPEGSDCRVGHLAPSAQAESCTAQTSTYATMPYLRESVNIGAQLCMWQCLSWMIAALAWFGLTMLFLL